jgi:hypothetical protein
MTKIAIQPNAAGTGTFTIEAPNSNSNRTLVLPDAAGEIYGQGNILGTVSQSGGVPTGAIIERGSNANGEFVKYADGTQTVRQPFSFNFGASRGDRTSGLSFPSAFSERPALTGVSVVTPITTGSSANASRLAAFLTMDRDASATSGRIISPFDTNNVWANLAIESEHTEWQAVYFGRWF